MRRRIINRSHEERRARGLRLSQPERMEGVPDEAVKGRRTVIDFKRSNVARSK